MIVLPKFIPMTGWWLTHPSEKYESQLGLWFQIYGKIKMVQTTNQISSDDFQELLISLLEGMENHHFNYLVSQL